MSVIDYVPVVPVTQVILAFGALVIDFVLVTCIHFPPY